MNKVSPAIVLCLAALAAPGFVSAVEYGAVLPEKSAIGFVSKQMGVAVNGKFPKFTAQVAFDPAKPDAAKVSISIDTAAIDAGSKDANDEVVGKQWFNVRMFPTATFTSTGVKPAGPGKYEIAGTLSIKGKSQQVVAPFTFKAEGSNGVFEGAFVVKRIDFAIGEGPWTDVSMVANDVQVNFRIVAAAASPAPVSGKPAGKTK